MPFHAVFLCSQSDETSQRAQLVFCLPPSHGPIDDPTLHHQIPTTELLLVLKGLRIETLVAITMRRERRRGEGSEMVSRKGSFRFICQGNITSS